MTYTETLSWGEETLRKAGIAGFKKDTELLLMHVTGKDKTFLLTHGGEESLENSELEKFKAFIDRRSSHIPLQLITGHADFMGLDFLVSKDVLIPRIDTEFLVEEAMRYVCDGADVLDMCTGSGCILLSLMKYKNGIMGTGADISPAALLLAGKNAERLGVKNAVFIESDLFSNVEGRFDHILCNPPYIRSGDIADLMEEVRDHEPHLALDGGEDGLEFYKRIASEAGDHLRGGGQMFLEIGFDEGEAVSEILKDAGYKNVEVIKDYSGNERVVTCLKS